MNMPASLVDVVIAFTVMECVILVWRHQRTGRGVGAVELATGLAPGLCLMIALRLADVPELPLPAVLALAGAGLAHAWDFRRRFAMADAGRLG
jgi:hypothetical protein